MAHPPIQDAAQSADRNGSSEKVCLFKRFCRVLVKGVFINNFFTKFHHVMNMRI